MTTKAQLRRRIIRSTCALTMLVGVAATGVTASGSLPSRVEASLTDATAQPPAVFVAVSPRRVLDTRPAPNGPIAVPVGKIGQGASVDLLLAGAGQAIPANAVAAMINITIDEDASLKSFLTVSPQGEPRAFTSANNAEPGLVAPNLFVAKLGTQGGITIFNQQGAVNVAIDLVGYFVPLSAYSTGGTRILSGARGPTGADGVNGDFFLDTLNYILYGPKTNGAYPEPGLLLRGPQGPPGIQGPPGGGGAAGAFETVDQIVTLALAGSTPIIFNEPGEAFGTVSHVPVPDTGPVTGFLATSAGIYEVTYHLSIAAAVAGTVGVYVNGVAEGPATDLSLLGVDLSVSASVLVPVPAGGLIELRLEGLAAVDLTVGESSTIVVEQIS